MDIGTYLIIALVIFMFALSIRPLRKTIGLLLVLLGFLACLTGIGMILGIPMIFAGGILLFI